MRARTHTHTTHRHRHRCRLATYPDVVAAGAYDDLRCDAQCSESGEQVGVQTVHPNRGIELQARRTNRVPAVHKHVGGRAGMRRQDGQRVLSAYTAGRQRQAQRGLTAAEAHTSNKSRPWRRRTRASRTYVDVLALVVFGSVPKRHHAIGGGALSHRRHCHEHECQQQPHPYHPHRQKPHGRLPRCRGAATASRVRPQNRHSVCCCARYDR